MKKSDFDAFFNEKMAEIVSLRDAKHREYAEESETFRNLKDGGKKLGIDPMLYAFTLMTKQYNSLHDYVKEWDRKGECSQADSELAWEKGRDIIVYVMIILGLWEERAPCPALSLGDKESEKEVDKVIEREIQAGERPETMESINEDWTAYERRREEKELRLTEQAILEHVWGESVSILAALNKSLKRDGVVLWTDSETGRILRGPGATAKRGAGEFFPVRLAQGAVPGLLAIKAPLSTEGKPAEWRGWVYSTYKKNMANPPEECFIRSKEISRDTLEELYEDAGELLDNWVFGRKGKSSAVKNKLTGKTECVAEVLAGKWPVEVFAEIVPAGERVEETGGG